MIAWLCSALSHIPTDQSWVQANKVQEALLYWSFDSRVLPFAFLLGQLDPSAKSSTSMELSPESRVQMPAPIPLLHIKISVLACLPITSTHYSLTSIYATSLLQVTATSRSHWNNTDLQYSFIHSINIYYKYYVPKHWIKQIRILVFTDLILLWRKR